MAKHLISISDNAAEAIHGLLVDYVEGWRINDKGLLEVIAQLEKIRGDKKWHS